MNTLDKITQDAALLEPREIGPLLSAAVTAGAGTAEQKSWNLGRPVTLIGRSRHTHIYIDGLGIEPVHAALLNTGRTIVLIDLVSRQGIFHNGQKIRSRVMQPGESFRLGPCLLRLEYTLAPRSEERPGDESLLCLPDPVTLRTTRGGGEQWTALTIGTVIGSRPGCDIHLPSKEVLPLHALLTRVGDQIVLASLGADRSIRVNGTSAHASILRDGDTITIWPICLQASIAQRHGPGTTASNPARPIESQEQQAMPSLEKSPPSSAKGSRSAGTQTLRVPPTEPTAPAAPLTGEGIIGPPPAPVGEVPQITSRLMQLEEQLSNSSKQLRQWQEQLEQYANGLIRRDAEMTKRAQQLDDLQLHLQETEQHLQARAEQAKKEQEEKEAALARQAEQLSARAQQLEKRESQLLADSRQVEQTQQYLQAQRQQVEQQWTAITAEKDHLAQDRERMAEQQRQQQAEGCSLEHQRAELDGTRKQLQEQVREFETQRKALQNQVRQLESKKQSAGEQSRQFEQMRAQLQQQADSLQAREREMAEQKALLVQKSQMIDRFGQVITDAWVHFGRALGEPRKISLAPDDQAAPADVAVSIASSPAEPTNAEEASDVQPDPQSRRHRGWWG